MKIVLIEPDNVLARATTAALKQEGHDVKICRSAQTAVHALDVDMPDCIILELQLGLHNGIEFLYELRSYPEWQSLPVVIYTVNRQSTEPRFAEGLRQLGVINSWYKLTVTPEQVAARLSAQLVTA